MAVLILALIALTACQQNLREQANTSSQLTTNKSAILPVINRSQIREWIDNSPFQVNSSQLVIKSANGVATYLAEADSSVLQSRSSCFGKQTLKIGSSEELIISSKMPFVAFFSTKTVYRYYTLEEYYGKSMGHIEVNYFIESKNQGNYHKAVISLDMKCTYITNPYLRMKGKVHIDYYQKNLEEKHQFPFILVCAQKEANEKFMRIYKPGYVALWVYCNLLLQIYHGYPRDRSHLVMFLIFLASSILIEEQLLSYAVAICLFIIVLLREKKESRVDGKACGLYFTFLLLAITLILFAYSAETDGSQWNSLWIALQNFFQIHISMFMVLRLIKLSRFRLVFWYFVLVSLLAVLLEESQNKFFNLNFKNPLDLSCVRVDLFFPLMMLPISNFFTSITGWMHRVIGVAITISAVMPLRLAIPWMGFAVMVILAFEIKAKTITVIRHKY